jgi:hypothetical protein
MKIRFNLLVAAGIVFFFSIILFSCSSEKKSAVPCPDFSHSRNMKSRHAQLKSTYPDQQARFHSNSTGARQAWFKVESKVSKEEILAARQYIVPGYGQAKISQKKERIYIAYVQPLRARMAHMVIPAIRMHTPPSSTVTDIPATSKGMETGSPGCDTIVFRNSDVMEAKVVEIGQREIRYRKCGDSEGPVFVVNITDVFMIKYPNGTRDYFTSERSPAPSLGGTAPKKTDGMAVAGFIGSLAGLFIAGIPLGIMAIVFGFVSLGKIDRHPERYKGRGFGIASIIIGAVDVIGMLIVLAAM